MARPSVIIPLPHPVRRQQLRLGQPRPRRRLLQVRRVPVPPQDALHHDPDPRPRALFHHPVDAHVHPHRLDQLPRDDGQLFILHHLDRAAIVRQGVVKGRLVLGQPAQ